LTLSSTLTDLVAVDGDVSRFITSPRRGFVIVIVIVTVILDVNANVNDTVGVIVPH
jgi:hypothetical protein